MKVAYADPPYLGLAVKFYGDLHPDAAAYDTVEGHAALIARMQADFPDGWAMSLHTPALRHILPLCPDDVRIGAWCKPFAAFKPGVNPAYCWEPVIWRGGHRRGRSEPTTRDYCAVSIALRQGFRGAKPVGFAWWVFNLLGLTPADELVDLFPGSGAIGRAWSDWKTNYYGLLPHRENPSVDGGVSWQEVSA